MYLVKCSENDVTTFWESDVTKRDSMNNSMCSASRYGEEQSIGYFQLQTAFAALWSLQYLLVHGIPLPGISSTCIAGCAQKPAHQ